MDSMGPEFRNEKDREAGAGGARGLSPGGLPQSRVGESSGLEELAFSRPSGEPKEARREPAVEIAGYRGELPELSLRSARAILPSKEPGNVERLASVTADLGGALLMPLPKPFHVRAVARLAQGTRMLPDSLVPQSLKDFRNVAPPYVLMLTDPKLVLDAFKRTDVLAKPYGTFRRALGSDSMFVLDSGNPAEREKQDLAHKAIAPYLSPAYVRKAYSRDLKALAEETVRSWEREPGRATLLEKVSLHCYNYSFRAVTRSILSVDPPPERIELLKSSFEGSVARGRLFHPETLGPARELISQVVSARRRSGEPPNGSLDVVDGLLKAARERSDLPGDWAEQQLMTLLAAGQESTKALLTWSLYYLAKNPEMASRVAGEDSTIGSEQGAPWTQAFINEVLRFRPPVFFISRTVVGEYEVKGASIPRGTMAVISPFGLGRLPELWGRDAAEFRPERFLEKRPSVQQGFVPFGLGNNRCVGAALAMHEAECFLQAVTRRYMLDVDGGFEPEAAVPRLVLEMKRDYDLVLTPREDLRAGLCG